MLEHSELTDAELGACGEQLLEAFVKFVEYGRNPEMIADWIHFQFAPTIMEEYFGRTGVGPVARVADHIAILRENRLTPLLESAVGHKLRGKVPAQFQGSNLAAKPLDLALSFALSVFARGLSYADRCGKTDEGLPYRSLWLRSPATKLRSAKAGPKTPFISGFPWGFIMACIFNRQSPLERVTFEHVGEVLVGVR